MKEQTECVCSNCGAHAGVVCGAYRFEESGLRNVILLGIELIRCQKCGNEDPVIPNMAGLIQCLALAVVEKPWRLKGDEVRYIRKYLKMTGEEFGRHIGVDKTCVSKWENEEERVGTTSDRMIRALALALGDGLSSHTEKVVRRFPEIKSILRQVEYRIDPETRAVEYV